MSGKLTSLYKAYPPGYTHLHQDTIPELGGDTLWASGYAAYDKLSPAFKKIVDGLQYAVTPPSPFAY